MYEEQFAHRLTSLRTQRNISARDMSLSLGQNPGYINTIENRKAFPTMINFFYICEFLKVTPQEFFDFDNKSPQQYNKLLEDLKQLPPVQLDALEVIIKAIVSKTNINRAGGSG